MSITKEMVQILDRSAWVSKVCSGCGQLKPLSEFYLDKSKADGHHTRCRTCKQISRTQKRKPKRIRKAYPRQTIGMKVCVHCNELKSVSDFNTKRSSKDGLQPWCQDCQRTYNREYWHTKQESSDSQQDSKSDAIKTSSGFTKRDAIRLIADLAMWVLGSDEPI